MTSYFLWNFFFSLLYTYRLRMQIVRKV